MTDNKILSHLDILEKDSSDKSIITSRDVYNLGPESKYIGALQCSNNNNFDEFFILGTDKIISRQTETVNGRVTDKETIEFRRSSDTEEYYIISKDKYTEANNDIKIDLVGDIYVLTFDSEDDMDYDSVNKALIQDSDNVFIYIDGDTFNIEGFSDKEEQILQYVKDISLPYIINVSTKEITKLHKVEGGIPRVVSTESISNNL